MLRIGTGNSHQYQADIQHTARTSLTIPTPRALYWVAFTSVRVSPPPRRSPSSRHPLPRPSRPAAKAACHSAPTRPSASSALLHRCSPRPSRPAARRPKQHVAASRRSSAASSRPPPPPLLPPASLRRPEVRRTAPPLRPSAAPSSGAVRPICLWAQPPREEGILRRRQQPGAQTSAASAAAWRPEPAGHSPARRG